MDAAIHSELSTRLSVEALLSVGKERETIPPQGPHFPYRSHLLNIRLHTLMFFFYADYTVELENIFQRGVIWIQTKSQSLFVN